MKILTFGELMLRLKTPEHLKILQADTFEASYGGAEANVAVSLATLGNDVSYVTKVPEHQVGQAAINEIRRFGVDTTRVLRGGGRVGIYYFEKGTNIRPTSVVYDRAYSAIAMAEAEEFDWEKLLEGVDLFYFSGMNTVNFHSLFLPMEAPASISAWIFSKNLQIYTLLLKMFLFHTVMEDC